MTLEVNKLTASEAIYGFCAWLSTRPESITIGPNSNCAEIVSLIDEFVKCNNLEQPRQNYYVYLTMPRNTNKNNNLSSPAI